MNMPFDIEARVRADATVGVNRWKLIEHDGAIFRGPSRGNPVEVWGPQSGWGPYAHAGWKRGVEWGSIISADYAAALMRDWLTDALSNAPRANF